MSESNKGETITLTVEEVSGGPQTEYVCKGTDMVGISVEKAAGKHLKAITNGKFGEIVEIASKRPLDSDDENERRFRAIVISETKTSELQTILNIAVRKGEPASKIKHPHFRRSVDADGVGIGSAIKRNESPLAERFPDAIVEFRRNDCIAIKNPKAGDSTRIMLYSNDDDGMVTVRRYDDDMYGDSHCTLENFVYSTDFRPGVDKGLNKALNAAMKTPFKDEDAYSDFFATGALPSFSEF